MFVPLHLFKLSDDVIRAVGEFVQFDGFLSDNPLEIENEELRLLLIFDGLDELSMQGKVAEETARSFVEEVRFLVSRFNSRQLRLQVIISGREVVVQANRSKFRLPRQLLYLLPYFVTESNREKYEDEADLLAVDQRQIWWQKYGCAKGKDYTGLPEELNKENLVDVTAQPLLNYLISLSLERDKLKFTQETNLNEIYRDLLDGVYERGYEKHGYRPTEGIEKYEFVGILEEIALACWHGDGRTTTVKEIEKHCDDSGSKQILDNFQANLKEDSKASITRLLTAFYFRESGGIRESEKTFEFTHKSFGEYLTATRIVEELKFICEGLKERQNNFRKGFNEKEALIKWANLCGATAISNYLFGFILDEMRSQDIKNVRHWQQSLCRLIEFMLRNGMPMEGVIPRPDYREEVRQARNAEEALLVVLNACARVTKEVSEIDWPNSRTFQEWILKLYSRERNYLEYLSFLKLNHCLLTTYNFAKAHLDKTNLSNTIFCGSDMPLADFTEANIVNVTFAGINFSFSDKLTIKYCNLARTIFNKVTIQKSNLFRINLEQANFREANLRQVNLIDSNLKNANFTGANFEDVNFKGSNLEGAIFDNTIYEGVDIETLTNPANDEKE